MNDATAGWTICYFYRTSFRDHRYHEWKGVAWLLDPKDPACWKARFTRPFTSDYAILDVGLGPAYDDALISLPARDLPWVFARTSTLDARTDGMLLDKAAAPGFPVRPVKKVPQFPDPYGQPGFQ